MPCAVPRSAARPTGARSRRGWRAPRSNPPRFQVALGRRRARGEWLPLRQEARGPAAPRLAPPPAPGGPRERGFRGTALRRSEERRVGKSVDLGGRRIIKKKKKKRMWTTQNNK